MDLGIFELHFHLKDPYPLMLHQTLYRINNKVKVKGVKFITCYSDELVARSALTISEVAADQHELMIPQCTMRPSIVHVNEQLDPRFAASKHTTASIIHTRPSPCSYYSFSIPRRVGG